MSKTTFIVVGALAVGLFASIGSAIAAPRHRAAWTRHAAHAQFTRVWSARHARGSSRIRTARYGRIRSGRRAWAAASPGFAPAIAASGVQTGRASYYAGSGRTAAGSYVGAATCAHRSLPFGTKVLVTNLANARQAVLTVNDRGPFVRGRVLDVSRGAAGMLGMLQAGVSSIRMQIVGGPG